MHINPMIYVLSRVMSGRCPALHAVLLALTLRDVGFTAGVAVPLIQANGGLAHGRSAQLNWNTKRA